MQVQQLHLFAVGKVANYSFTQGAETGGFVIPAEFALAILLTPSRGLQGGKFL